GRSDQVVQIPFANRQIRESEALVGMVVNTLPLRVLDCLGGTFKRLLNEVTEKHVALADMQAFALTDLLDGLDLAQTVDVPIMFQFSTETVLALGGVGAGDLSLLKYCDLG